MKGDIILKILETVGEMAVDAADLLAAITSSGYGASRSKLEYEISKYRAEREVKSLENRLKREAEQRYYNLVYYLKNSGLLIEKEKKNKKFFILTKKGKEKIIQLKIQKHKRLPHSHYIKEKINKFIIIAFDIPEQHKRKRDWLRQALTFLDFAMVQKSVWMGKTKIPKEFLSDIHKMGLVDFVEIFEITKTGSLEKLKTEV